MQNAELDSETRNPKSKLDSLMVTDPAVETGLLSGETDRFNHVFDFLISQRGYSYLHKKQRGQ
jgi:hypothetical protein